MRASPELRAALRRSGARGKKALAADRARQAAQEAAHARRQVVKAATRELKKWAIAQGGLDEEEAGRELEKELHRAD